MRPKRRRPKCRSRAWAQRPSSSSSNLDAKASQSTFDDIRIDVNARAQDTFRAPAFVSEQFSLDGPDAVSSFPSGAFSVHSARSSGPS